MKRLADLTRLSEAEWLELRRRGIGSSDAPVVLGVSPYRTPLQLWAEKLGLLEPAETEAMRWGRRLEPIIAEEYARETGRLVTAPMAMYQHDEIPFVLATPDRFAESDRGRLVVEIKTAGAHRADEWREEPPPHYQVQCQHLLAVTGLDVASIVVLIGGQRLLWKDIERNDSFIRSMLELEREFWRRVELGDPPPASATDNHEVLAALYPRDTGATVLLPPEAERWDRELQQAKEELRRWEHVKDALEARLKAAIGDASYGRLPSGAKYSWRLVRQEIQPRPAEVREFRVLRRLSR